MAGVEGTAVVRGRRPSYGEGVTYRPVLEAVEQLLGAEPESGLDAFGVGDSARAGILSVLRADAALVPASATARGVLALFEAAARVAPLVVLFDDVHCGEPGFLDLVDHAAASSRDAPVLLLCLARPELLEQRPDRGGGKPNAASLALEPLRRDDAAQLLGGLEGCALVSPRAREQILVEADGNPFFLEEMVGSSATATRTRWPYLRRFRRSWPPAPTACRPTSAPCCRLRR